MPWLKVSLHRYVNKDLEIEVYSIDREWVGFSVGTQRFKVYRELGEKGSILLKDYIIELPNEVKVDAELSQKLISLISPGMEKLIESYKWE